MPIFKAAENKKCHGKGGFKTSPKYTLEYITKPEKAAIVSSLYLNDNKNYAEQFEETKKIWNKAQSANSRKYYHFIHSFSPEDNVSPETTHEITEKICEKSFPHSEVVIATHTDTAHVHCHIVICSVCFDTGKMLQVSPKAYTMIKDLSNELAREYGLSEVDFRKRSKEKVRQSQAERQIILRGGTSWKQELCEVIDLALETACSMNEFTDFISKYGIELSRNTANTISFKHPDKKKPIRGEKLGANYTKAEICRVLEHNRNFAIEQEYDDLDERKDKSFIKKINDMQQWALKVHKRAEPIKERMRREEEYRRNYYENSR